ncbi:MAG: serine/threonine protein kinase, partial [Planctomycetaceae bacterium]|nr:serine/threonine protein kinase [Planctomycetaceae bacterium]
QDRPDLLRELLYVEFEFAHRQSAVLTLEPYLSRFPEYASIVHEVADDVGHYNVFKNRNIAGYTLLDELGRGGMGVVYRAKSDLLNNFVAFKMVHQRLVSSPETLRRFSRELEMIGRLKHPNIVEAKHAGIAPDGSPFLVMELVDGTTLSQWGKQNASTTLEYVQPSNLVLPSVEGTLSKSGPSKSGIAARQQSAILRESESARIVQVCTIIRDVALGLQAIHEAGLVHRDIKPGNIMLLPDGGVKILDLGLAKLREHIAEHPLEFASQTQQGHVLGTPGYMAPEQMQSARQVDIRADIYSLGCTFFFLLYGCALTDKQPKELLVTLPKKLQTILDRMLAANPAARFQEPKEIVDALDSFLGTARKSSWSRMVVGGFIVMSLTVALLANIPSAPNPRPSPPSPDVPPIPDSGVIQIDNMIKQQRMFDNVQAAIELRYQGNGEQAVSELKTLAAELRSSPFEGSDNLLAEILSAQGDCLFFAGLASDSLPEKIVKRLMAWYEEAETLTDSDYARVKLHCKLKIADSIHSTTMDGGSRARKLKTVRSGFREDEDKNLFLCCWLAEAISAMDDGLLRNFIEQFELSTESELITREALDLRLFALERLIYRNMNTDRETLAKDLRALDSILLAPYPDANSCVYLNRYFDLAIRHCDPTDHGQLVKYLCRLRPLSIPQGASLVLIYFSPQSDVEGFAIYYPAERQESQRFELPFNRDDVKKAVKQGESLVLPPELVALIWRDIATGVPIVLSWDDTACWSLRRDAFSNEDWAFDQSITIEEILGQMK